MILVTGASGHIGSRVTEILAAKGAQFRAMSRTPDRVGKPNNIEVVYGDFEDPKSLEKAFDGIKTALIISGNSMPGKRCFEHKIAFQAAKDAKVDHIVYLSLMGSSPESAFPYSRDHYESEKFLAETGVGFTSLRNAFYLDMFFQKIGPDGIVRGPAGDGKGAFITREDVAQAAAAAALNPPVGVIDITGPQALSIADVTQRFSTLVGRELSYQNETVDVARVRLQGALNDEWKRDVEIGWFEAIERGELIPVTDSFEQMTGKPPCTIEQYYDEFPQLFDSLGGKQSAILDDDMQRRLA